MKKFKINHLEREILDNRQMSNLKGGCEEGVSYCNCACKYAGKPGGSSSVDNGLANADAGLNSSEPGSQYFKTTCVVCVAYYP